MGNTEKGDETRRRILDFIIEYTTLHCYPPTIREIMEGVGLKSTSSTWLHINKMLASGMLETDIEEPIVRALRVPGYQFVKKTE